MRVCLENKHEGPLWRLGDGSFRCLQTSSGGLQSSTPHVKTSALCPVNNLRQWRQLKQATWQVALIFTFPLDIRINVIFKQNSWDMIEDSALHNIMMTWPLVQVKHQHPKHTVYCPPSFTESGWPYPPTFPIPSPVNHTAKGRSREPLNGNSWLPAQPLC